GRQDEPKMRQQYKAELPVKDRHRVVVKGFITNMSEYTGVADVVVTRAGMTSLSEFATQAKACVVVPNPLLSGGHQLKNAQVLADRKAVRLVYEDRLNSDHHALMPPLTELLDQPELRTALGAKFNKLAVPKSAELLAMILYELVEERLRGE